MRLIQCKKEFVEPIQSGSKTSTIRKTCQHKVGDIVGFKQGSRFKPQRLEGEYQITQIDRITLDFHGGYYYTSHIHGHDFNPTDIDYLCEKEGFKSPEEMAEWFWRQYKETRFDDWYLIHFKRIS